MFVGFVLVIVLVWFRLVFGWMLGLGFGLMLFGKAPFIPNRCRRGGPGYNEASIDNPRICFGPGFSCALRHLALLF